MSHTVYLALGTNLGDRLSNLKKAIAAMAPVITPLECSPVYETPPWGYTDQPAFLNQVIKAQTDLDPQDLLLVLKDLETRLGREPTFRYGPRLIDLDILFYDRVVLQSAPLAIPHPRLAERAFVLVPLADLAPDFRHPTLDKTVSELLAAVDTASIKWYSAGECGKIGGN
ncbi:MAG TPA: 2-amino-4-hydroxy-6-hydroxymethyldihydropteridine diphosphokinase [Anaerolineales bacterium]|nr:2-amino-4-hydroxy-6-hydroxymethyldihydropteridine diphosphokinase [Anaerolineales bacterium]